MISRATMNLKPVVIELDGGPIWKCPLWVKSRHVQRKKHVRFTPESRHVQRNSACPLCANSGHEAS